MDPIVTGALIAGGTSLVGGALSGIFGNKATQNTNAASVEATRLTNQANREMYDLEAQRQNQWNERQYEEYWKQRQYDSVLNQKQRYESAGINPYFALGNIQSGNAAGSTPSPSGAVTPPQMSVPSLRAYDPAQSISMATQGVSNAVNSYFANRKVSSETTSQDIKNLFEFRRQEAELRESLKRGDLSEVERKQKEEELYILQKVKTDLIKKAGLDNRLLNENINDVHESVQNKQIQRVGYRLDNQAKELNNEVFRDTKEWQKKQIFAGFKETLSRINLNNQNASYLVTAAFLNKCQSVGVRIDNFQKNKINWLIRDSMKQDIKLKRYDLGEIGGMFSGKYNPTNSLLQSIATGLGIAGAAYVGSKSGAKPMNNPNVKNTIAVPATPTIYY